MWVGPDEPACGLRRPTVRAIVKGKPIARFAFLNVSPHPLPPEGHGESFLAHAIVESGANDPLAQRWPQLLGGLRDAVVTNPCGTENDANVWVRRQEPFQQSCMLKKLVFAGVAQVRSHCGVPPNAFRMQNSIEVQV